MDDQFSIVTFLEDHGSFSNKDAVVFLTLDEQVHISCKFPLSPNAKGVSVDICNLFDEAFVMDFFKIISVKELEALTPGNMLRLYHAGVMKIACAIDEYKFGGELIFKKNEQGLIATDEANGHSHLVGADLKSFDEFISYTSNYFLVRPTATETTMRRRGLI